MSVRTEDIRAIMLDTLRVQLATLDAGIAFWGGWAGTAAKFVQAANQQLGEGTKPGADVDAAIGRLTDASRAYLREMAQLPAVAIAKYSASLEAASGVGTKSKPARRARAKA